MKKMAIENKGVFVRQAVDYSENRGFASEPLHRAIGASLTGVIVAVQLLKPGSMNLLIASKLSASTM